MEFSALKPEVQEYIRDMVQLHIKHKASIGGCGCCGSPWVEVETDARNSLDHFEIWNEERLVRFIHQSPNQTQTELSFDEILGSNKV